MDWHELNGKITPYMVRIETQDGSGSGFLFTYNRNKSIAGIATAYHVVKEAHEWRQPIKLYHQSSKKELYLPYKQRGILFDKNKDSASILISSGSIDFPKDPLTLMNPSKYKRVGVEVGWVGFPSVAYPEICFFKGCISAFLMNDDCYLIDGVAINGVSGGPVFSDIVHNADIIGTVSAYLPNRVGGATLPGLLKAQDISHFASTIKALNDLDDAKEKKEDLSSDSSEITQKEPPETSPPPTGPPTDLGT
jgi:hypothetical protein